MEQIKEILENIISLQRKHLALKSQYDEIEERFHQEADPVSAQIKLVEDELSDFRRKYVPGVSVIEVVNYKTGIKYLRGSVRYFVEGEPKRQTASIHLGKLSDFPQGINDPKLDELVMMKAIELNLRKKASK
jgi:hypothetical protein